MSCLTPRLLGALRRIKAGGAVTPQQFNILRHRGLIRVVRPQGTTHTTAAVSVAGEAEIRRADEKAAAAAAFEAKRRAILAARGQELRA